MKAKTPIEIKQLEMNLPKDSRSEAIWTTVGGEVHITHAFKDGQPWASTCGRLFAPIDRLPTLADARKIAMATHGERDAFGTGDIRPGFTREYLISLDVEFEVIHAFDVHEPLTSSASAGA